MAKRIKRKSLTTHTTSDKRKTNKKMGSIIRSRTITIMRKMRGPYEARRTKIVETTNTKPKKGTKFRQLAPHRPMPVKNGQIRRIDQMKRARDPKANKPIIGAITAASPMNIKTKNGSVNIPIYLYPKERCLSLTSSALETMDLDSPVC